MKRLIISIILSAMAFVSAYAQDSIKASYDAKFGDTPYVLISKDSLTLKYIVKSEVVKEYKIACSKYYGNKHVRGDNKTPEGEFKINEILNSKSLKHDFGDGKGPVVGAYGPWFLRLDVPGFRDIGIHGTHLPESIGTRATEGCIRMNNEHIKELKELIKVGTPVVILADSKE